MTNNNYTRQVLFGTLLVVTTVMASWPFTTLASGQTATDGGGVDNATTIASEANATAATENNNRTGPEFLFIQNAQSGSVSEVNATTSTLELSDVSDKTIMFPDRPERIVASESTADFIGNWSMGGPNSFAVDPPNAVLVLDDEKQKEELAVIELYNPEYNPESKTLKYDIIDENETATTTSSIDLPKEFGQSTLVIDDDGPTGEPTGVTPNNNQGDRNYITK